MILAALSFLLFKLEYNCFTMLLVSAVHQCESAICIYRSLPLEPLAILSHCDTIVIALSPI